MTRITGKQSEHPELVGPTRELLEQTGLPWVIENVPGAPLRSPVQVCGVSLGLQIWVGGERFVLRRHREFEASFPLFAPACTCRPLHQKVLGVYGGGGGNRVNGRNPRGGNGTKAKVGEAKALMQIDWMTMNEMCQAIPPAYTELIGRQLSAQL